MVMAENREKGHRGTCVCVIQWPALNAHLEQFDQGLCTDEQAQGLNEM